MLAVGLLVAVRGRLRQEGRRGAARAAAAPPVVQAEPRRPRRRRRRPPTPAPTPAVTAGDFTGRVLRLRLLRAARRTAKAALDKAAKLLRDNADVEPHDRGALRRARHGRVQPGAGREARERGARLPGERRRAGGARSRPSPTARSGRSPRATTSRRGPRTGAPTSWSDEPAGPPGGGRRGPPAGRAPGAWRRWRRWLLAGAGAAAGGLRRPAARPDPVAGSTACAPRWTRCGCVIRSRTACWATCGASCPSSGTSCSARAPRAAARPRTCSSRWAGSRASSTR